MASATGNADSTRLGVASCVPAVSAVDVPKHLLSAISAAGNREQALKAMLRILMDCLRPVGILYFGRNSDGTLAPQSHLSPAGTGNIQRQFLKGLTGCCEAACRQRELTVHKVDEGKQLNAWAAPVSLSGKSTEVIGVLCANSPAETQDVAGVLQVVAAHVSNAELVNELKSAESEARNSAALLDLLGKCASQADVKQGCVTLVNELREFLQCDRVAVGLCDRRCSHSSRLMALSGLSRFDQRSDFAATLESALDEAILRDKVTRWPPVTDLDRGATLAHQRVCEITNSAGIVSSALYDDHGKTIGAWLFLGRESFAQSDNAATFMRAACRQVGTTLDLLRRAELSPFSYFNRAILRPLGARRLRVITLVVCLLVTTMFVPIKYRIGCDCQVQPVVRRFVAAPYDGKLEQTMVEPGDEVVEDQLLARLDGRELRWELAGLEADYNRAEKDRDASMAIDNIAKAQQAALEMERLQLKTQLISNRLERLEIRSPIAGIVIAGDLKKTEGAPLSVGQAMFEIAPLDQMIVEVEIPERDILHVQVGQELVFRVDAYPGRKWFGALARIFPRAELRDQDSVYIAEVNLDNHTRELRPGMKGRAKITGARHSLGWILFHKPFESFRMFIGW